MDTGDVALPLAKCGPHRCSEQGSCVGSQDGTAPPRCACHKSFDGAKCELVMLDPQDNNCYNKCSGGCARRRQPGGTLTVTVLM